MLTIILALTGCLLLFLVIWGITITLPTEKLLAFFPEDVQEKLKPRVENLPMSFRRILGWIILILFVIGYLGLFVVGGMDGLQKGFTFNQFFMRFFIIGAAIKAFDIICLDYFLLTKTHFFQRNGVNLRELASFLYLEENITLKTIDATSKRKDVVKYIVHK